VLKCAGFVSLHILALFTLAEVSAVYTLLVALAVLLLAV
jgi:hypothetical protein